jgi:hypothetical protein
VLAFDLLLANQDALFGFGKMGCGSVGSRSCRLFGLGIGCHCCGCHFGFNVVDGLRAGSHYHLCDFTLGIV